jgi:hypothetical protein
MWSNPLNPACDDRGMTPADHLDDRQVEALLRVRAPLTGTGRTGAQPADLTLVEALGVLRSAAVVRAPEPSPALASLLRDGFVPDAVPVRQPPRRSRLRAAVLAVGAGTFVLTAATGANALPAPGQRAAAAVLNALTPFHFPTPSDARPSPGTSRRTPVGGRVPTPGPSPEPGMSPHAGGTPAAGAPHRAATPLPTDRSGRTEHAGSGPDAAGGRQDADGDSATGSSPTDERTDGGPQDGGDAPERSGGSGSSGADGGSAGSSDPSPADDHTSDGSPADDSTSDGSGSSSDSSDASDSSDSSDASDSSGG